MKDTTQPRKAVPLLMNAQTDVHKIGRGLLYNDDKTQRLVEYAVAKAILDAAKQRFKIARKDVSRWYGIPEGIGPRQVVHQDAFATLAAQRIKGAMRVDHQKLRAVLLERGIPTHEVDAIFEQCTVHAEPHLRMEVILK